MARGDRIREDWMRRLLLGFILMLATAGLASAQMAPLPKPGPGQAVATFAGGCFWCTESDFDHVPGVISTTSGYTGGHVVNPDYEQVSAGRTGHAESVQVIYDPSKVVLPEAARLLLAHHRSDREGPAVLRSRQSVPHRDLRATTTKSANWRKPPRNWSSPNSRSRSTPRSSTPARSTRPRTYHQDFYLKNPTKYKFYRWNCGRDQRLEQLWGKPKGEG